MAWLRCPKRGYKVNVAVCRAKCNQKVKRRKCPALKAYEKAEKVDK